MMKSIPHVRHPHTVVSESPKTRDQLRQELLYLLPKLTERDRLELLRVARSLAGLDSCEGKEFF